jgi:uncharacterized protein (DUF305 family)
MFVSSAPTSKSVPIELGLCLPSGTLPRPVGLGIAEKVEDWTMTKTAKHLSLFVAVICAVTAPALAQEPHDHSHTQSPSATTAPTSTPPADNRPSNAGMGMQNAGGMCMMGKDHMGSMKKMMQEMHGKMAGGAMTMQPKGDSGPSSLAFNGIAARMHTDMDITYTGRPDVDFAKGMIPHHQAAVDMAKTEIAFGKDPQIRKIAEEIVKTQEAEIANLQQWLKDQTQQ